ncbi:hypothetical protein WN990_15905 [Kitasatospora purpeofusca]|uniref:hypothetical protein n=1 Tax=Kitasatospora purpeofusca TaxID=67352 RepID=UPI0030F2EE61
MTAESLAAACEQAAAVLADLGDHFIERVLVDSSKEGGEVDVFLRYGPGRPDAVVSLTGILHFAAGPFLETNGAFVDGISLDLIASARPDWPEGLTRLGSRRPGTPDLVSLSVEGPMAIEVVGRTVSVALSEVEPQ